MAKKVKKAPIKETFKVSGISLPISAKLAGDSLMDIYTRNNSKLTPELIVREATNASNPLHKCFEWDDKKAGKAYRLTQARKMITCIVITKDDGKGEAQTVKAFVNIKKDDKGALTLNPFMPSETYYVSINDAMSEPVLRSYTVDLALVDLKNWMAKYDSVKKLANLFTAVEREIKKLKSTNSNKKKTKKKNK